MRMGGACMPFTLMRASYLPHICDCYLELASKLSRCAFFFLMYQQCSFRSLNRSGQVTTLSPVTFSISLSCILVAWNNTPRYSLDWLMRLWVRVSVCAYVLSLYTLAWKAIVAQRLRGTEKCSLRQVWLKFSRDPFVLASWELGW